MSEDYIASIQMSMVRVARMYRIIGQLLQHLANEFPEFTKDEISEVCRPVIECMYQNL